VKQMMQGGMSILSRAALSVGMSRNGTYYSPAPRPHSRLHRDEPQTKELVRNGALTHPTFGYR
jgi:hypothetical protein